MVEGFKDKWDTSVCFVFCASTFKHFDEAMRSLQTAHGGTLVDDDDDDDDGDGRNVVDDDQHTSDNGGLYHSSTGVKNIRDAPPPDQTCQRIVAPAVQPGGRKQR